MVENDIDSGRGDTVRNRAYVFINILIEIMNNLISNFIR